MDATTMVVEGVFSFISGWGVGHIAIKTQLKQGKPITRRLFIEAALVSIVAGALIPLISSLVGW